MSEGISSREEPVVVGAMTSADIPAFLRLIDALADYEKLPRPDAAARCRLEQDALSEAPPFSVLLARRGSRLIGYAVYFQTYSTFLARPTLYLEDIFILEDDRGCGAGRALMRELAKEALRRGCGRMEWQVLAWNKPSIEFYERLGAERLAEWHAYRLTGDSLARLAELEAAR